MSHLIMSHPSVELPVAVTNKSKKPVVFASRKTSFGDNGDDVEIGIHQSTTQGTEKTRFALEVVSQQQRRPESHVTSNNNSINNHTTMTQNDHQNSSHIWMDRSSHKGYTRRVKSAIRDAVLRFEDITFAVGRGKRSKVIVQQVGATVTNGHVLAIMGPSGAGKTTLINTLTQSAFYGRAYGSVMLNGVAMNDKIFKRYCYVVKQQDTNWPYLTTRETLMYAAELYDVTDQTTELVQDLIQTTGLMSCAETKCQRLSGGQQRRLSLAIALLKQPSVLFLDEPTSGLDAASAAAIMRALTQVAREKKLIIICTIHQPSSKVYNDFDQVMLLSKGREAYVGNAETAPDYFASIGYPLPPKTNPAEHLLDLVNADFSSNREVDEMLNKWWASKTGRLVDAMPEYGSFDTTMQHNLFHEFKVMFRRHTTLILRDPVLYVGRVFGFLLVNIVFGVVYIAARDYTQDQAVNKLWINGWFIGVPSNMAVVTVYKLNQELKSIFIENKNGMGSPASYLIARTIMVLPIFVSFAISALGIPGYVIQDFPMATMWKMCLLFVAQIATWECSAECFAAVFDEVVLGMLVHTAWWLAALLFSGYLVALNDMFWPLKIFYYTLPYNYYVRSAMYLIFKESTWEACTDPSTSAVCVDSTNGLDVLEGLERIFPLVSTEDTYWGDFGAMLLLCVVWKLLAVIVIIRKSRSTSHIKDFSESQPQDYTAGNVVVESTTEAVVELDEQVLETMDQSCKSQSSRQSLTSYGA